MVVFHPRARLVELKDMTVAQGTPSCCFILLRAPVVLFYVRGYDVGVMGMVRLSLLAKR